MDELFPFLAGLIAGLGLGFLGGFLIAMPGPDEVEPVELAEPDESTHPQPWDYQ
jgi:hypothetical protein